MKCPYCDRDNYEKWEEFGDIAGNDLDDFGSKGLIDYENCEDCDCKNGEKS